MHDGKGGWTAGHSKAQPWYRTLAVRTAAIFCVFGIVWITLGDALLLRLIDDPATLTRYQTYKGWLFVLFTTVLIYVLMRRAERRFQRRQQRFIATLDALHQSERQQAAILNSIPDIAWLKDTEARFIAVNKPFADMVGAASPRELIGKTEFDIMPPELARTYHRGDEAVARQGTLQRIEEPGIDPQGRPIWLETIKVPVFNQQGTVVATAGISRDVTERKHGQLFEQARNAILDWIIANHSLTETLEGIARHLEGIDPDYRVMILLLDARTGCLVHGASPSLPACYIEAVDGLVPAIGHGSCGTAAFTGEPVIVADVMQHPLWAPYRTLAAQADIAACWSLPFKSDTGKVLGTLSIHLRRPRAPTARNLTLIQEFMRLTGLAVQRAHAEAALRQAATVFENTREGVFITDLTPRIIACNRAARDITGYGEAELLDQTPALFHSGRQDRGFYQSLWATLKETGNWQGEIWNRRKNGEIFPQWLTISTVADEWGKPRHYVAVFSDITRIKESEARLEHLAHYDPLTDLPNRLLMQSRLHHALQRAHRDRQSIAVLFLDLDQFKKVNDSLGHPVGDELLVAIAQRLSERLREADTLARLGGDEFLIILENIHHPEYAASVAQALIDLMRMSFHLPSGHEIYMGVSIGISLFPEDGSDITDLIRNADVALYQAKSHGPNTYRFHTAAQSQAVRKRLELETRLRQALEHERFVLHYQPLIAVADEHVIGVEALVRWICQGTLIPPNEFIPIAEDTGLIIPLGLWVLRTACRQMADWRADGLHLETLAVNLSPRQLNQPHLVRDVGRILEDTGLPNGMLELELTESSIMAQGEHAIALLDEFKQLGARLAIDDFGTGYSSLAYLKRFPIDKLKIDRSFVEGLPDSIEDCELVATIINMGHSLGMRVLAEGVETPQQLRFLRAQGCDGYQGFLHGKPMPAEALATWLRANSAAR